MGQIEIYEWLKHQRATGNLKYFTAKEIRDGLQDDNINEERGYANGSIKVALIKLEAFGYLDAKRKGKNTDYNRSFRVKEQYVNIKFK